MIYLLQNKEWDFVFSLFRITDKVQHKAWGDMVSLLKVYQEIDEKLGELIKDYKDTDIVIMSDHGFGPNARKEFHVNTWLKEQDYLKLKAGFYSETKDKGKEIIRDFGKKMMNLLKLEPRDIPKKVRDISSSVNINYEKSIAYSYILGIDVTDGRMREEIFKKLENVKDQETGESVIKEVWKREDLYSGKFLKKFPSIVVLPYGKYSIHTSIGKQIIRKRGEVKNPGYHAVHRNGIFIARGPNIKENYEIQDAEIIDIAPTILHMMSCSVPKDMDGKVLKKIFKEDSEPAMREIKHQRVLEEKELRRIEKLKRYGKI